MKKILLAVAMLISTSAFAVGIGNDNPGTVGGDVTNVNTNLNSVSSRIDNDVRANAAAFAAAQAKSSSNSAAMNLSVTDIKTGGNTLSTGGNTLTVNEAPIPTSTETRYGGTYTVKNTPDVVIGNVYPTAPCMGGTSVGGSGPGFSVALGTSWKDDECGKRETARSFNSMGMKEDALAVLCSSEYAAVAPSCKAMAPATKPVE